MGDRGMSDTVVVELPGAGPALAALMWLVWLFLAGFVWLSDEATAMPSWSSPAMLAALAVLLPTSLLSAVSRRVATVDPSGVRLSQRPIGLWGSFVPRTEIASVLVRQLDDSGISWVGGRPRVEDPSSSWTVALKTRAGREIVLGKGFEYGDEAERAASEIRAALMGTTDAGRTTRIVVGSPDMGVGEWGSG